MTTDSLDRELLLHSEATIRAIETGRVELAKRRLNAYRKFAESFLDAASARGIVFSDESALSLSAFDWPTPIQIVEYAKKGALAAIRSKNPDLLWEGARVPIPFLRLSVIHKDFLFYFEMLRLYPQILTSAYESGYEDAKRQIIDLSWQPLSEFCWYRLVPLIAEYSIDKGSRYISQILWTFSDMAKVAMEHSDNETFTRLSRELDQLFENIGSQGLTIQDQLSIARLARQERALIWFGLGAWAIHRRSLGEERPDQPQFAHPTIAESEVDGFFEVIARHFPTLDRLSEAYFQALTLHSHESRWSKWTWESLGDRRPRRDAFGSRLTWFYCLAGLRLVLAGQDTPPTPHRDLQFRVQDIERVFNELNLTFPRWERFLPVSETIDLTSSGSPALQRAIDRFMELNSLAIQTWKRAREEEILQASLDPVRLESFQEDCFSAWQVNCWLPVLFQQIGRLRSAQASHDEEHEQIRSLVPKEEFIADQDMLSFGLGQSAGAKLAEVVTEDLLMQIESSCSKAPPIKENQTATEVLARIAGMKNPAGILLGGIDIQSSISEHDEFSPQGGESTEEFKDGTYIGRFGKAPMFHIFDESGDKALIFDLDKLGTLSHYRVPEHDYKGLAIRVDRIDEDGAKRLFHRYPKLIPESLANQAESGDYQREALRWFRLRVEVSVGIKLELEGMAPSVGVVIPIAQT